MIENLFQQIGFHPTETRVYLCLAQLGKSTAQLVAQRLEIPRTTVYSALDSLVKKGFVSQDAQSDRRYYVANGQGALERYIEEDRRLQQAREA